MGRKPTHMTTRGLVAGQERLLSARATAMAVSSSLAFLSAIRFPGSCAENFYTLSLKYTHVEKKIFGEKQFSSPRRIFCHVNRFSSDEDRERDGALVSRIEDSGFSLLSVVHSSFPGFLRTNCASWLRISIRIECNLWSSEQIGFKRAREGGREGEESRRRN